MGTLICSSTRKTIKTFSMASFKGSFLSFFFVFAIFATLQSIRQRITPLNSPLGQTWHF